MADYLERAAASAGSPATEWTEPLHCGVDLGTATIVLAVVDDSGDPVYCDAVPSSAVRDGVVVDFHGAAESVGRLRERAEAVLGRTLERAATAYPPGVGPNESRACQFVLERAGLDCSELIDEVSAANTLLGVREGVVVDVGGGSTGVGIIRGGLLIDVGDLPGGGHHLNLILAGALGIGIEEAEQLAKAQTDASTAMAEAEAYKRQLQALMDAACTYALVHELGRKELELFLGNLQMGGGQGKVEMMKALGILDATDLRFIRTLSQLRNTVAHKIHSVGFTFEDHFQSLDQPDRNTLIRDLAYGYVDLEHMKAADRQHSIHDVTKHAKEVVWEGALVCLALIYLKKSAAKKKRIADAHKRSLTERLTGVSASGQVGVLGTETTYPTTAEKEADWTSPKETEG